MKKHLLIFCFLVSYSCGTRRYVYIQNKTNNVIEIYTKDLYRFPIADTVKRITISGRGQGEEEFYYSDLLQPDSLFPLGAFPGREQSKSVFIDTALYNRHPFHFDFLTPLIIVSGQDTAFFTPQKIVENLNESWADKHSDPTRKIKGLESMKVVWKYK